MATQKAGGRNEEAMQVISGRDLPFSSLLGTRYIMPSPPIRRLFDTLADALAGGRPGTGVYADTRMGKTRAVLYFCRALRNVFGHIPYLHVPVRSQTVAAEGGFFSYLLDCAQHRYASSSTVSNRRTRFTRYLCSRAARSPHRTVILIVDEAQWLHSIEFEWLLNVHNECAMNNVTLFCINVGQLSLVEVRNNFIAAGRKDIYQRFLPQLHRYYGFRSPRELEMLLQGFDTRPFPQIPDVTFREHFFPGATTAGLCLADRATDMWEGFLAIWRSSGHMGSMEIPAQDVFNCVERLLILGAGNTTDPLTDPDVLKKAIADSEFRAVAGLDVTT